MIPEDNIAIRAMADVFLKEAMGTMPQAQPQAQQKQPGKMEKYLPWYGAAGLGMVGHEAGKLLPKKYQMAGRIGGTLLGTGLGVHGGEAIGKRLDQRKTAAAEEKMPPHPGATLGKSLLGFGVGTAAGYAGMKGLDALMRARGGSGLPRNAVMSALPLVTGLGGLAYTQMQNKTVGKMRQDHLQRQEKKRGSKES